MWDSYDDIEDVLEAAHKYDMPGPVSVIRLMITSPRFLHDPLRLFAVAARFDWGEEAKLASRLTLTLSIHDKKYETTLKRLSSPYLLKLMNLHRTRITKFRGLIDSNEYFERGNHKPHCDCGERDDTKFWWKLKATMTAEMDKRPMGDTLLGGQFQEWPEATVCWDAKCSRCSKTLYSKDATMKTIESCLCLLPASI